MASRKTKKAKLKSRLSKRMKQRQESRPVRPRYVDSDASPLNLKPKVLPGETIEDLAVFTKTARVQLSEDLQAQAGAIADSLDLVHDGQFDQALECTKSISRGSPFADWRLFIRGLIAFYRRDLDAARQNWMRLDRARRPARIASTLLLAGTNQPLGPAADQPPAKLVEAARELQNRLGAIAAAKQIAAVRHRDPETCFSASQAAMLGEFRDDFRKVDNDFVARFSEACVRLSFHEPNPEIFLALKRTVPGPPHDPKWNLLSVLYFAQFTGAEELLEASATAYLNIDLPRVTQLRDDLRNALASRLCGQLAELELQRDGGAGFPFSFVYGPPDYATAEKWARDAIKRYPANRRAHDQLIRILNLQLAERDLNKRTEAATEKRLLSAKEKLVETFPDEVETTLWLIDKYFDDDHLDLAEELVRQLGGQRLDDPRAKALPWKLKLREAMRLSRRKGSLDAARKALETAEALWPIWLKRDWLPFLRAAIELRAGERAKFEQLNTAARHGCGAVELLGDVMTFAALQQMNLPSAELKPYREIVERHAQNAKDAPLTELCGLGSFFWDLSRTGLRHKGYRLQASKFGKALVARVNSGEQFQLSTTFEDACSWMAGHSFWRSGNGLGEPNWTKSISPTVPKVAAAVLEWLLNQEYSGYRLASLQPQIALLKEAARTENDAYYRYRYDKLAEEASAKVAEFEGGRRERDAFGGFDPWSNDEYDDDDDDDDDDEVDEYEEENLCDCPTCRAKRARQAGSNQAKETRSGSSRPRSSVSSKTLPLFDEDDFEDNDQDDDLSENIEYMRIDPGTDPDEDFDDEDEDGMSFEDGLPPIVSKVYQLLGPRGRDELIKLLDRIEPLREDDPLAPLAAVKEVLKRYGVPPDDAASFLLTFFEMGERGAQKFDRQPMAAPSLTAEERRESRKQRRKELRQKMKKQRQRR